MSAKPTARKRTATPTPIISQRLQLLAQATARLAKAERLVKQWRRDADRPQICIHCRVLRRCASELSRILKP